MILDPASSDPLILDPLASDWLVLIVESAGAIGALKGDVCIEATVQGCVEVSPMWTAQLIVSPTFSGSVEIDP